MKSILLFLSLIALISCKQTVDKDTTAPVNEMVNEVQTITTTKDTTYFDLEKTREIQAKNQLLKKEGLIAIKKDILGLQDLVISKTFFKEDDDYELDYTYPYLDETRNAGYKKFNNFMTLNYLNTERTINEILEDNEIICDTLSIPRYRDKRIIDFKIESTQNDMISILMYKENYYSGMLHSTYMFETINYDLRNQEFINFENFFISGSEEMVFNIINKTITDRMNNGDMYYDCWQMSMDDFMIYKNNFVISGENLAFYLDDCIICPSHTGEYKVLIPISELAHFIQRKNLSLVL